jgi:hypothetical protein
LSGLKVGSASTNRKAKNLSNSITVFTVTLVRSTIEQETDNLAVQCKRGQRGGTDKTIRPHSRVPIRLTGGAGARETHWSGSGTTRGAKSPEPGRRSRRVAAGDEEREERGAVGMSARCPLLAFLRQPNPMPSGSRPSGLVVRAAGTPSTELRLQPPSADDEPLPPARPPPRLGILPCSFVSPSTPTEKGLTAARARAQLPPSPLGSIVYTTRPRPAC